MSAKSARLTAVSGRQKERSDLGSTGGQPLGLIKGFRPDRGGDSLEGFASDWWITELMRTPGGKLLIIGVISTMLLTACGAGQTSESTPGAVGVTEILAPEPVEVPPTAMWTAAALTTLLSPQAVSTPEAVVFPVTACDAMVSEGVLNSLPSASPVENPQEFEVELNAFLASQGINQPARIGETLVQVQAKVPQSWETRVMARAGAGWFVETLDENGWPRWAAEKGRFHDRPDAIGPVAGQQVDMKELPKPTGKWAVGAPVPIIRPECSPAVTYVWVSNGKARLVFDPFSGQWRKFQTTPEPAAETGIVSPVEAAETAMFGAGGAFPEFVEATFPAAGADPGDEILTPIPPAEMGPMWTENWGVKFPSGYTVEAGQPLLKIKVQFSQALLRDTGIESIYIDPSMLTTVSELFMGQLAAQHFVPNWGDDKLYAPIYPEFSEMTFADTEDSSPQQARTIWQKAHDRLQRGEPFVFDDRFTFSLTGEPWYDNGGGIQIPPTELQTIKGLRLIQTTHQELLEIKNDLDKSGIRYRYCYDLASCVPGWVDTLAFVLDGDIISISSRENTDVKFRNDRLIGDYRIYNWGIGEITPVQAKEVGAVRVAYAIDQMLSPLFNAVNFWNKKSSISFLFGCGLNAENCQGPEIRSPNNPDHVLVRVVVE